MRTAAILLTLLLASCGSISETQNQSNAAAAMLEKELGSKPQVGFNIHNGALARVTFIFDGSKIGDVQVKELEERTRRALAASFKERPKVVQVMVQWQE